MERPATAVAFYERAFGARVLHRVGDGEDIVAQLAVGDGAFWVSSAGESIGRFSPGAIGGGTGRILLTVDDPDGLLDVPSARGQPRLRRSATSTAGVSAESSTLSATSGRSGDLLPRGRGCPPSRASPRAACHVLEEGRACHCPRRERPTLRLCRPRGGRLAVPLSHSSIRPGHLGSEFQLGHGASLARARVRACALHRQLAPEGRPRPITLREGEALPFCREP